MPNRYTYRGVSYAKTRVHEGPYSLEVEWHFKDRNYHVAAEGLLPEEQVSFQAPRWAEALGQMRRWFAKIVEEDELERWARRGFPIDAHFPCIRRTGESIGLDRNKKAFEAKSLKRFLLGSYAFCLDGRFDG